MKTHGTGQFTCNDFQSIGYNVIIEDGVKIFHPETIAIKDNVYIGHDTILHGYPDSVLFIDHDVWIGPQCYFHGAGGIYIQDNVGIGPGVRILTSYHDLNIDKSEPIRLHRLKFKAVVLESGCDIGISSTILPGVTVGCLSQVGAGAVVTKDVGYRHIVAGNPAELVRKL